MRSIMSAIFSVAKQSWPTSCLANWVLMMAAEIGPLSVWPSPQVPSSAVILHQTCSQPGSHRERIRFTWA